MEDLRVPGVARDASVLLPYVDHDHATPTMTPDLAEKVAAMKAAAFNLELTTLRYSKDPSAKYKVGDVLERADDSLTRRKMKEQHAATNGGQTLDDMITSLDGLDDHAKKNAHSLISDKRDAATDKLAAMSAEEREQLEDKAAAWADQVMDVTQSADRDDSEHADKIASILGPRTPEEIEVIRARIRLQSSGVDEKQRTTLHEQLDRTFTGNDKDIALAGLSGNHANVAARQLVDAAADSDPERVHRIVKELDATKLAELRATNPVLLGQIASNIPADQRAQIEAALGGRRGEAEGGRIESLLQPVELSTADGLDTAKAKRKIAQKEAQDPERLIEELQRMPPADLAEARETHGARWDQLIAERYKDVDATLRLRIEAAARGDAIGERALRLRQGMRTYDQRLVDQALANPDLQSADPEKRAAAEAQRRELDERMRAYDATDQQTQATAEGRAAPANLVGRSTQDQLDAYYARAKEHDTDAPDMLHRVSHVVEKDQRMARIREKAHVDKFAATEMWTEGDAHASTKVRRAELAGNAEQKAEILEHLDKKDAGTTKTLAAQAAEYSERFGGRDMLAAPDLSSAEWAVSMAGLSGDDQTAHELVEQLVRDDMNDGELRVEHVRETGVLADRTRAQRVSQMRERADNSHSEWLAGSEMLTHMRGGNRGSEDRLESAIRLMERGNAEGVDDREQARRDKSATGALALQRDEKQREAAKVAQVISIASKIAAILTANPLLFVAVDAGFSALRIAAQEMIANEAFEMTPELQHMGVDVVVNFATARFASMGKGVQAGTQAAKGVQVVQRIGMGAAGVAGAAAHSALDGDGNDSAVIYSLLGAAGAGNYVRGKLEGLFKGSGWLSRTGRAMAGTLGEAGTNIGISGGHVDMNTLLDAGGNTVQDRMHAPRRGTRREHEQVVHGTHDVDAPRRHAADADALRRTKDPHADTRAHDVEAHARDVEARRQAEAAYQAHSYLVEDVAPTSDAADHSPIVDAHRRGSSLPPASSSASGDHQTTAAIDEAAEGPRASAGDDQRSRPDKMREEASSASRGSTTAVDGPQEIAAGAGLGVPRTEGALKQDQLRNVLVNQAALVAPSGSRGRGADQDHLEIRAGEQTSTIGFEVGNTGGAPARYRRDESGNYHLVLSNALADADVARAMAHGVALVQRDANERAGIDTPGRPPPETEGRAAELRVVFAQVDAAGVRGGERIDSAAHAASLDSLLRTLSIDDTPAGHARLDEALGFDPVLKQRAALHLAGYQPRVGLDARSDLEDFAAQRTSRAASLEKHIQGPNSDALRSVDALSMGAQLRLEEGHRIFDPTAKIKPPKGSPEFETLNNHRLGMTATLNDPSLNPEQRRARLFLQIEALASDPSLAAYTKGLDAQAMKRAAGTLGNSGQDHGGMVLDLSSHSLKGEAPDAPESSLRDLMHKVDAANQASSANGLGLNYVIIVHDPVEDPSGRKLSTVEVVARKQPQSRLAGQRAELQQNKGQGDLVVDIGVGRGGFAAESAARPEGGLVVQTEWIGDAAIGQTSRSAPGIVDGGPLSPPGSVMVYADILQHPELLSGAA